MVVFITVQNLVAIDAVFSKIWKFECLNFSHVWFENAYSRPKIGVLRNLTPSMNSNVNETPKGTFFCESASFESSRMKIRQPVWPLGELPKVGRNKKCYISPIRPEAPSRGRICTKFGVGVEVIFWHSVGMSNLWSVKITSFYWQSLSPLTLCCRYRAASDPSYRSAAFPSHYFWSRNQ